jgi:hypothetical protein
MIKKSEFSKLIDAKLKPKLMAIGFQEMFLEDCIHPEVLYNKGRLWFGASWDYRDRYLEINLGHLYWFKDVMLRVIILGDYSSYYSKISQCSLDEVNGLAVVVDTINNTIESAIEIYNKKYDLILQKYIQPKKVKYAKGFVLHLGKEVSMDELKELII